MVPKNRDRMIVSIYFHICGLLFHIPLIKVGDGYTHVSVTEFLHCFLLPLQETTKKRSVVPTKGITPPKHPYREQTHPRVINRRLVYHQPCGSNV